MNLNRENMQPESNRPPGPKKPITKQWQPQAMRSAKSVKKAHGKIDAMTTLVQAHPEEKLSRAEIADRARSLLNEAATKRNANAALHVLTAMFFKFAFKYELGQEVDLDWAWKNFLKCLAVAYLPWAQALNAEGYRQFFLGQIAGHTASTVEPMPGRVKVNGVVKWRFNNKWPSHAPVSTFVCPGMKWEGNEVFAYTVKNMSCTLEHFEQHLRLTVE